jgi:hypothetical protein
MAVLAAVRGLLEDSAAASEAQQAGDEEVGPHWRLPPWVAPRSVIGHPLLSISPLR